jgi:hypothetical protein
MSGPTYEFIKLLADLAIVPLVTTLFSMHGRLSRIEGALSSLAKKTRHVDTEF